MTDRRFEPADGPDRDPIREIDLLAYVDGRLDGDPGRREAVERYLKSHPAEAARVTDFQAQNEALGALGADWLADPVPERLLDAVYARRGSRWMRETAKIAAAVALVASAAGGGWLLGTSRPHDDGLRSFATQALADHGRHPNDRPEAATADRAGMALQAAAPLNWLTRRISVRIRVPDLGPYGYGLVAQKRVRLDGETAVRLGYHHRNGSRVNIYLRPRWEDGPAPLARTDDDTGTALYWFDGPLAVAMTVEGDAAGTATNLVPAVRQAIAEVSVARSRPPDPFSHDALLLDPAGPAAPGATGRPAPSPQPPQVRTN